MSYIFVFTISLVIAESLNLITINRITGLVLDIREWLLKPGLVGVIMVLIGRYLLYFYKIFCQQESIVTFLALVTNVLVAGFFMILTGVLKPKELINFYGMKKG
jgi:stage V sporulation protein B